MSTVIRSLMVKVGADLTDMQKGFKQASKDLNKMGKDFSSAGSTLTKGLTLPILGAVAGLGAMISKSVESADNLQKLSDVTGLSAERLQELTYVGTKLDVELETITGAQAKLTKTMQAAQNGTKLSVEAYKKLGVTVTDSNGNLRDSKIVMQEAFTALGKMTNETERDALAMQIFGKSAMALNPLIKASGKEIANLTVEAHKSGAVLSNEMIKAMDSFGDNMDGLKLSLGGAVSLMAVKLMPTLEKLIPVIQDKIIPAIGGFVKKIADLIVKFSESSPEIQKMVVAGLLFVAGIGPMLSVVGSLTTGMGGLMLSMSKAAGVLSGGGGLVSAFGALIGPAGLAVIAIAAIVTAGVVLYNYFSKDAIPEIDRFGDSVSDSTKKAAGAFMDLNDNATVQLNELNWSGQVVTKEMAASLTDTFNKMAIEITTAMESSFSKSLIEIQKYFSTSSALTETEEAKIVQNIKKGQQDQAKAIEDGQIKIKEILNKSASEKRELTASEQVEINRIQQDYIKIAIGVMTENEAEQKAIFERMKSNASALSAQQAAEVVENSTAQKDKVVADAQSQADTVITEFIRQRDETKTISAEQADKLIADALRQKDESIKAATSMHSEIVNQAKLQAGEHVNEVDWETGEIKSRWAIFWEDGKKNLETMGVEQTSQMNKIGQNVVRGFYEGFKSQEPMAKDHVTRFFNSLSDDARKALDINFPSGVSAEVGLNITKGLAGGIQSGSALGFNSLPQFAMGTPHVPYDMTARIHQGEAIIPASQNRGGTANIYVELDGKTIVRAIGQPLVDMIRVKTGAFA